MVVLYHVANVCINKYITITGVTRVVENTHTHTRTHARTHTHTSACGRACVRACVCAGVRFSGRPVANGAQQWLRATSIFYYSSPHGDLKYLRSCNILDPAKINGMLINISEVLSLVYINHTSCVCDTFDIARNVAKP